MTEAEWLACEDPRPMLEFLWGKVSDRKLRLFECACCRYVWHELKDERSREAVQIAELYADGMVSEQEFDDASTSAGIVCDGLEDPVRQSPYAAAAYNVALPMGWWGGAPAFYGPSKIVLEATSQKDVMRIAQASLLRDIFPFHPITLSPSWLTSTVVSLANQMYDSRDFSAMPILADALMDSGCDNETILTHCRGPGPHVRVCWLIDLLTGRE